MHSQREDRVSGAGIAKDREMKVVKLSRRVRLVLPPLLVSSLPQRAIGFSFPRGMEGKVLGLSIIGATVATSVLLVPMTGVLGVLLMTWLMGGTGVLLLYNSIRPKIAFVKVRCYSCRLRPIIEDHEMMHLQGVSSEDAVWAEARRKYSYDGLGLEGDPHICSFCPIAKRLKENPRTHGISSHGPPGSGR